MNEDTRCCGTGTCLINAEGQCWCGQRWDGEKMCFADKDSVPDIPQPVVKKTNIATNATVAVGTKSA